MITGFTDFMLMLDKFKYGNKVLAANVITAEQCLEILTDEEKVELLNSRTEIEFEAGETIIKRGFAASNILFLEEGLAKLDIISDGRISTVDLVTPKSFIGIICTFACQNFDFSAVALEKSKITSIDIHLIEKFIHLNGDFAYHLMKHMSVITNHLVHRISRFIHKNIEGAISILLLDFSEIYQSDVFILPVKRKEIAHMLGYSKESVINTLSKFNKEGILHVHEKRIEILDKKRLQYIAEIG